MLPAPDDLLLANEVAALVVLFDELEEDRQEWRRATVRRRDTTSMDKAIKSLREERVRTHLTEALAAHGVDRR